MPCALGVLFSSGCSHSASSIDPLGAEHAAAWRANPVQDYWLTGYVAMLAGTLPFETQVIGGKVVSFTRGRPMKFEEPITIDYLFDFALKKPGKDRYVEVRERHPIYHFPTWMSTGSKVISDMGFIIAITGFTEGTEPPVLPEDFPR